MINKKYSVPQYHSYNLFSIINLAGSLLILAILANIIKSSIASANSTGAITLPPNFAIQEVPYQFNLPTDMDILPSGDILVAEKGSGSEQDGISSIYLVKEPLGEAITTKVITINTNPIGDAGILGIVLDPHFDENHYFYVWYSSRGSANQWDTSGTSKYRLSRFTLDLVASTVDPESELVVIDNIPRAYYHNGGALEFDDEDQLYISTGDTFAETMPQDLTSLGGKILRIKPNQSGYTIPLDNPFVGAEDTLPEIFAYGLRNPFRMTKRSSDGKIFIGDVGEIVWEEIDEMAAGANYGWPIREGPCPRGERLPCPSADSSYTDPIFYYEHPKGVVCCKGGSVTGMTFYAGGNFPPQYHDKLFVADFNHQFIAAVEPDSGILSGSYFAENAGSLTDMEYFDDSLYIIDIVAGKISRIYYDYERPIAQLTLDTTQGAAPLTVNFSAAGTTNPYGLSLTYFWDFGDGTDAVTSSPEISQTYLVDGDYTPKLQVIDSNNNRSNIVRANLRVYSGEMPQITLTNLITPEREEFHGGDYFVYQATRSVGTSGLDPVTPYTWDLSLYHNEHFHPLLVEHPATNDILVIPRDNHGDENVWYRFTLKMHTASGQTIEVSRELMPEHTEITLQTSPPTNINAIVNGTQRLLPYTFTAIAGVELIVDISSTIMIYERKIYEFEKWDGQPNSITNALLLPPANNVLYTAHYKFVRPANLIFMPLLTK